jgi:iron complex outermembrane receptor protein
MNRTVRYASIAALEAAVLAFPALAVAQAAGTPPPLPAADTGPVEEIPTILVTARRRTENIEQVPASITALNEHELEQRGVLSQSDLQESVPGLTIRETQGSNSLTFSMRGQTVDAFTGSQSAVVPYFDEVQLFTGGASTFFDLQSVQVLKGPQGTLFGRNATGGAVLYTSIKPSEQADGYVKLRGGNYNLREVQGASNLSLAGSKALLRVAGDVIYQDGYQLNTYNGQELGKVARQSARITLLLRPIEGLENTLVTEFDHSGGNSTATKLHTVNRCGSSNGGFTLNCTADFLFSPAADSVYGPGTWAAYVAAHPKVNPNGIAAYLDQDAPKLKFWEANEVSPVGHDEQDYFLANTTTYDLAQDLQLKNIFGASRVGAHDIGSSVGAPYLVFASENLATGQNGNRVRSFDYSDELQLQGKALGQALTYVAGFYYQDTNTKSLFPQVYFDLSPMGPPASVDNDFQIKDRTEALYTQGTYDFRDWGLRALSLTGGFRYTWESFRMIQLPDSIFTPGTEQSINLSNPSWTAGLSYQLNDALLVYAQGRRSWRSGGFNGTAPAVTAPASGGGNLFAPEYTRDVELGAKFSGKLLGRPARLNLAVYNQWIDNVQRAEFPVPPGRQQSIAVTINVPEARVTGAELDASVKPVAWLETGLSGALTRARFPDGQNQALIFGQQYVFGPYADAPRASGSLYTTVFLPAPEAWGLMDLRADLYGQTGFYFSNNDSSITPNTRLPGYGLVNLRYDWNGVLGSKFSLAAFVRNLADKEYYTGGFSLSASLGVNSASVGTPRMFGAELSYDF